MKYVVLVSHGAFAPGLHNALKMLVGEDHEDIISAGLENGMGADAFEEKFGQCLKGITAEDEILLFGDIVGGSPLTTAANVIAKKGLMDKTAMVGGMNLPIVLSAVLMKDTTEMEDLVPMLIPEAREELKEFRVVNEEKEEEI